MCLIRQTCYRCRGTRVDADEKEKHLSWKFPKDLILSFRYSDTVGSELLWIINARAHQPWGGGYVNILGTLMAKRGSLQRVNLFILVGLRGLSAETAFLLYYFFF